MVARPGAGTTTAASAGRAHGDEVPRFNDAVEEPSRLIVKLLYGSELRLLEALALRVKDVDLERLSTTVRDPLRRRTRRDPRLLPLRHSLFDPCERCVDVAATVLRH